jgi:hypothetical protein
VDQKFVRSVRELWKEESRRRFGLGLSPETGLIPSTDERITRSVPSQGEIGFKGGVWDSTEMWESKLDDRLKEEAGKGGKSAGLGGLKGVGRPLGGGLDSTGAGVWDKVSTVWVPSKWHEDDRVMLIFFVSLSLVNDVSMQSR